MNDALPIKGTNMTKKSLLVAGSLMLFSGTIALQGCFDSGHGYGYGPEYFSGPASYSESGYYSGPAYYSQPGYYAGNGYGGDYDEHRNWHDRDWWVNNHRDWVQDHHQDWIAHEQDMNNDARAIREGRTNVHHDRQELREDLRNGDYDAAAHEQTEIQQRRANVRARKADLNADQSNRYYSDDDAYGRR
jgi:hypothetical protein